MRNFLYFFLLMPFCAYAQSAEQNYIMGITYKFPYEYTRDVLISGPDPQPFPLSDKIVNITYYDGLGRPIQQIGNGQSNNGKDIITHIEYDSFGRQAKEYLPYEGSNFSGNYNTGALTGTLNFYSNPPNPNSEATSNPFSEKLFEPSPLNRVLKQGAPGNAWAMSTSANPDNTIKFEFQSVSNADMVKFYRATAAWDSTSGLYIPSLTNNGNYQAGQLYKTITKDENWTSGLNHSTEEFKDKEGKIILKRTYNSGTSHDTYYVYDQYGNLSYVLPPLSDGSGSLSDINEICYQYKYDNRNRLVEKKLPGKQWEFIVYDNLDRMVATGPVLSPFSNLTDIGWLFTKYDTFGRIVYTGWIPATVTSNERSSLQAAFNIQTSNLSETKSVSDNTINGVAFRYTSSAWPTSGYHVLTVNYYDDYDYLGAPASFPDVEGQPVYYNLTVKPKGLPTGSWTRALESSSLTNGELSYTFYDHKVRPIRTWASNYLGGYTLKNIKLDFSGKILYTITEHKRTSTDTPLTIREDFTYTSQDRLVSHIHKVNNNSAELLSLNAYNELGQLIFKKVGGSDLAGSSPLQKIDYSYTVRGWLKGINSIDRFDEETTTNKDLFAFGISYNDVSGSPDSGLTALYNGNIAETRWMSRSDNRERGYTYRYDGLNRLRSAYYFKNRASAKSYDELMEYDKNGNILRLNRNGDLDYDSFTIEIDDLGYTYGPGNQLKKVKDYSIHPAGFHDGVDLDTEYTYDGNGNMITDENKSMRISYNHLNLPIEITFRSGGRVRGKINYLYDASGKKLKKTVNSGAVATATDYISGFQYVSGVLDFFPTAEGYVKCFPAGGARPARYNYVFNYTDHLGNIRVSYGMDPADGKPFILEENHYYPFGLKHEKYNSDKYEYFMEPNGDSYFVGISPVGPTDRKTYQYKFQGQERQDELGLNWDSFKWRNYDYAIGRFMSIDPLTEQYNIWSPYAFSGNRVIDARELEGLEPHSVHKSLDEAVKNFGTQYNGLSIRMKGEIGVTFYKSVSNGVTTYSYNMSIGSPNAGMASPEAGLLNDPLPKGASLVGIGHTHKNDNNDILKDGNDKIIYNGMNNFTDAQDYDVSDEYAKNNPDFEGSFLFTPNGKALVYVPSGKKDSERKKDVKRVSNQMPSDPDSTTRENTISPNTIPEVLPYGTSQEDIDNLPKPRQ